MSASREPQPINSTTWYYEYPRSFVFVVECRDIEKGLGRDGYHKTIQFRVQARTLERSLKRMAKPERRKQP